MWTPSIIEKRSVKPDLSSSGQCSRSVTQIICDGMTLCNACEAVYWDDIPLQLVLCEACLTPHCGGGGCVAIRQLAGRIIIMPDFAGMKEGDWNLAEYSPPQIIMRNGSLLLSSAQWTTIRTICPDFPKIEALAPLSTQELVMLYHYQAPRAFLPDPFTPEQAKWDMILTSSGEDTAYDIDRLKTFFSSPETFSHYELVQPPADSYPVSMFLDLNGVLEWPVLCSGKELLGFISHDLYFRLERTD